MVVNFEDKKFPQLFKNKFYIIKELINSDMKVIAYSFKYDIDFNMFIVFLNFEFFSINIKFSYEDFKHLMSIDIYNKIRIEVESYLLKMIYK